MDLEDLNRMTLAELGRFVAELTRRFGETAAHPRGAPMPDDTFQQFAERVLREHDDRMAHYDRLHTEHTAHMAQLDRQYAKLDAIAADVAATNDRLEDQLHSLARTQRTVTRLLERQEERIAQNEARLQASEAMLQILIDMQRHRNGGQTP